MLATFKNTYRSIVRRDEFTETPQTALFFSRLLCCPYLELVKRILLMIQHMTSNHACRTCLHRMHCIGAMFGGFEGIDILHKSAPDSCFLQALESCSWVPRMARPGKVSMGAAKLPRESWLCCRLSWAPHRSSSMPNTTKSITRSAMLPQRDGFDQLFEGPVAFKRSLWGETCRPSSSPLQRTQKTSLESFHRRALKMSGRMAETGQQSLAEIRHQKGTCRPLNRLPSF